ncbi:MAG TPA: sigma-54 dependent transcriptional regulator [Planctomycetota bacterium]|nr:sigma-54 dependent transcriptional regulator [Planctomycetota bacterium]
MSEARRGTDMHESLPEGLRILLVDDEPNIRKTMLICLEGEGHRVISVSNRRDAAAAAARQFFDMAFVDIRLGNDSGLDLIPELLALNPGVKIVVITAYASIDTAVEAIKRGAQDYLPKPFTPAQVGLMTRKVQAWRALEQQLASAQEALGRAGPELDLSTRSPIMQRALSLARQVAGSHATILISGETGTGKGVLARSIHRWSPRAEKPFAVVSCPSLAAELLESELFGHTRGAFTGAVRDNPGRVAACEGGTLFLDEIADLPLSVQPKLLRFIQEREYERVGDSATRCADVRVIAATNRDLLAAVKAGTFREDLYYRLNVFQIDLPPLRERAEDIEPLSRHLLSFFALQNHRRMLSLTPEALAALHSHSWPGNVRELRNTLERAAILCSGETVGAESFPFARGTPSAVKIGDPVSIDTIEEQHIKRLLESTASLEAAAAVLGIDQATLWRRRKKYGI